NTNTPPLVVCRYAMPWFTSVAVKTVFGSRTPAEIAPVSVLRMMTPAGSDTVVVPAIAKSADVTGGVGTTSLQCALGLDAHPAAHACVSKPLPPALHVWSAC